MIVDLAGTSCALYGEVIEFVSHIFATCVVSFMVWYKVFMWLCRLVVLQRDLVCSTEGYRVLAGREKIRRDFFVGLIYGCVVHPEGLQ